MEGGTRVGRHRGLFSWHSLRVWTVDVDATHLLPPLLLGQGFPYQAKCPLRA